jgi:hypothetical protein
MKRIFTTLLMAVGITGPLVSHLFAQRQAAVADIPFAFVVSHHTMPAGTYNVTRLTEIAPVFGLRDGHGSSIIANFSSNEPGKPTQPSLTFACSGKECVLAKITPPGSPTAYALSPASVEKNFSHKLGMAALVSVKIPVR